MNNERWSRIISNWEPPGIRRRERPPTLWKRKTERLECSGGRKAKDDPCCETYSLLTHIKIKSFID